MILVDRDEILAEVAKRIREHSTAFDNASDLYKSTANKKDKTSQEKATNYVLVMGVHNTAMRTLGQLFKLIENLEPQEIPTPPEPPLKEEPPQ